MTYLIIKGKGSISVKVRYTIIKPIVCPDGKPYSTALHLAGIINSDKR